MFIFGGAILLLVSSADTVLQAGGRVQREAVAVNLARTQMADLRRWTQSTGPTNFSNWASYPGVGSWQPCSVSGFEYRVTLKSQPTMTPSQNAEGIVDPTQQRKLNTSLIRARVEVRYGGHSSSTYRLDSLIADSRRNWRATNPIVVTCTAGAAPANVAKGGSLDFQAAGFDSEDHQIQDLMFSWSIISGGSFGMFKTPEWRDGHAATFIHQVPKFPPPGFNYAPPGAAWVAATARFCGQERTGTYLVNLQ